MTSDRSASPTNRVRLGELFPSFCSFLSRSIITCREVKAVEETVSIIMSQWIKYLRTHYQYSSPNQSNVAHAFQVVKTCTFFPCFTLRQARPLLFPHSNSHSWVASSSSSSSYLAISPLPPSSQPPPPPSLFRVDWQTTQSLEKEAAMEL